LQYIGKKFADMCTQKNIQRVYFEAQPTLTMVAGGQGLAVIQGPSLNFPLSYRNARIKEVNINSLQFSSGNNAFTSIKLQAIPLNGLGGVSGRNRVAQGTVSGGIFTSSGIQYIVATDGNGFKSEEGIEATGIEILTLVVQAMSGISTSFSIRIIIEIVVEIQ
jgi:hypothetical protein